MRLFLADAWPVPGWSRVRGPQDFRGRAEMRKLQEQVRAFVRRHGLEAGVEARMLDLVSEVGELAKEVLKANRYGRIAFAPPPAFAAEMGDVLFPLICLAKVMGTDLREALVSALRKYEQRIGVWGSPDSRSEYAGGDGTAA